VCVCACVCVCVYIYEYTWQVLLESVSSHTQSLPRTLLNQVCVCLSLSLRVRLPRTLINQVCVYFLVCVCLCLWVFVCVTSALFSNQVRVCACACVCLNPRHVHARGGTCVELKMLARSLVCT